MASFKISRNNHTPQISVQKQAYKVINLQNIDVSITEVLDRNMLRDNPPKHVLTKWRRLKSVAITTRHKSDK